MKFDTEGGRGIHKFNFGLYLSNITSALHEAQVEYYQFPKKNGLLYKRLAHCINVIKIWDFWVSFQYGTKYKDKNFWLFACSVMSFVTM
jgi:hypothetical protein